MSKLLKEFYAPEPAPEKEPPATPISPFLGGGNAVLRHRIGRLPERAQVKLLRWHEEREASKARKFAEHEAHRRKTEQFREQQSYLSGIEVRVQQKTILIKKDELEALREQVAAMKAEVTRPEPPRAERTRGDRDRTQVLARLSSGGGDLESWILNQPSGRVFRTVATEVKGESAEDLLTSTQAAIVDFANEIVIAERADPDIESRLGSMRSAVADLARKGQPKIYKSGRIDWPEEKYTPPGRMIHLDKGNAFAAWIFQDALVAKLEQQIRNNHDEANSLTAGERAARIEECEQNILALMREEEALFCLLEERKGVPVERPPLRSPLAYLEIEPI